MQTPMRRRRRATAELVGASSTANPSLVNPHRAVTDPIIGYGSSGIDSPARMMVACQPLLSRHGHPTARPTAVHLHIDDEPTRTTRSVHLNDDRAIAVATSILECGTPPAPRTQFASRLFARMKKSVRQFQFGVAFVLAIPRSPAFTAPNPVPA